MEATQIHTKVLLNQIETSDGQEKSSIKDLVEKCEVREAKELVKHGNMATELGIEPKPIVMRQVFRPETEDVNSLKQGPLEAHTPTSQEKQQ